MLNYYDYSAIVFHCLIKKYFFITISEMSQVSSFVRVQASCDGRQLVIEVGVA